MPLISLMTRDILIRRPSQTTDLVGDTVLDWNTPVDVVAKAYIETDATREEEFIRASEERIFKVFVPPETDVEASDRIVWGSLTMEVVGPPMERWTPDGLHHKEVLAREHVG